MVLCSWIFVAVLSTTFVLALLYSWLKVHISRKYFNKSCLQEYEKDIEEYCFLLDDGIEQIAEKMNKQICYKDMKAEAFIEKENPDIICVSNKLSEQRKNFAITHELGHFLRGYESKATRNKRSLFSRISPEEQICDYYAAAILLPKKGFRKKLEEIRFDDLSDECQMNFIKDVAREKCIVQDVVYRRIEEMKLLS